MAHRIMFKASLANVAIIACSAAWAQPSRFFNVGSIAPPPTPPGAETRFLQTSDVFDPTGDRLSVEWIRCSLQRAVVAPLYLDVDTRLVPGPGLPVGLTLALYDATGNLVAVDDREGSYPDGFGAAGLSFGSTDVRLPPSRARSRGQDGPLEAGVYWLALAAGDLGRASAGSTDWNVTTSASYRIDFFGDYAVDIAMYAGNTTRPPAPANDLCQNAIVVRENPDPQTPAWIGTNLGALNDGQFPCASYSPPFDTKDIWFRYVPSRTGYADIVVTPGPDGFQPVLDRYDDSQGCGSPSLQCVGGTNGPVAIEPDCRMLIPVRQGEPILLAMGDWFGGWGNYQLDINLLPLPCPLTIPEGATSEGETECGQDINNGCEQLARRFDSFPLGRTVSGTIFSQRGGTARDADWSEFTLPRRSTVRFTYASQMPLLVAAAIPSDDEELCVDSYLFEWSDQSRLGLCQPRTQEVVLDAGRYILYVSPAAYEDLPCGSGYERYWVRLDAEPVARECPPCAADYNQDGGVDGADLAAFFPEWGDAAGCSDVNQDGGVDGGDLEAFFIVWQAGGC